MLDRQLLAILVDPVDKQPLVYVEDECLYNPRTKVRYAIEGGIPVLLADEAVAVESDEEHKRLVAAGQLTGLSTTNDETKLGE